MRKLFGTTLALALALALVLTLAPVALADGDPPLLNLPDGKSPLSVALDGSQIPFVPCDKTDVTIELHGDSYGSSELQYNQELDDWVYGNGEVTHLENVRLVISRVYGTYENHAGNVFYRIPEDATLKLECPSPYYHLTLEKFVDDGEIMIESVEFPSSEYYKPSPGGICWDISNVAYNDGEENMSYKLDKAIRIYVTSDPAPVIPDIPSFSDISYGYWGREYVDFAVSKGLMNGTGDGMFSPNGDMTLGMALTVMARLSGVDTTGSDPWYKAGFDWAGENGIHSGGTETDVVERQELIMMLWKLAGSPWADESTLAAFPDAGSVSGSCKTAVAWAIEKGITNGSEKDGVTFLEPTAATSRVMYAAFLMRAYNLF